ASTLRPVAIRAMGVNAAKPPPLCVVACGLLRRGNANDLHVSVIVTRRETLHFQFLSLERPHLSRPNSVNVSSALPPRRGRTVRAQDVDAGKRLPIRARMIVEERKRMEETPPPDWVAVPSPRTERKLLIK